MTAGIDDTGKITRNPDTETAVLADAQPGDTVIFPSGS